MTVSADGISPSVLLNDFKERIDATFTELNMTKDQQRAMLKLLADVAERNYRDGLDEGYDQGSLDASEAIYEDDD